MCMLVSENRKSCAIQTHLMYVSTISILLHLGGKCLLNWFLVFLQRMHISRSFLGIFSVSLAAVDTALTFFIIVVHIQRGGYVLLLGYLMTKYDLCLLVQIIGQISRVLRWPIAVVAAVDHFLTIFLWFLTALYFFLLFDFIPDIPNHDPLRCRVIHSLRTIHIIVLLFLVLACVAAFSLISPVDQSQIPSQRSFIQQTLQRFVYTWIVFPVFLAILLFLPMGIPSYLDLSIAWLCFLNSLLVAVVLCVFSLFSQGLQGLVEVPADNFCDWSI
uniref:G protein-coupled receptor 160 n=1 Tax=Nothobranchius furzeri TaxID=105023 RepID=A0A8C6LBN0_NOTFU